MIPFDAEYAFRTKAGTAPFVFWPLFLWQINFLLGARERLAIGSLDPRSIHWMREIAEVWT